MANQALQPHMLLLYVVTVACCCGVTMYQFMANPLDDYIPKQPSVDNSTFANVD